jgi:hypothetical protein
MHLYLSQYWRIVPNRNIPRLSSHLQRIFHGEEAMPFDCDEMDVLASHGEIASLPSDLVLELETEWNVSLGHLKLSYQRVELLEMLNQKWLILNHIVYLSHPMSYDEWRNIISEYLHRRSL